MRGVWRLRRVADAQREGENRGARCNTSLHGRPDSLPYVQWERAERTSGFWWAGGGMRASRRVVVGWLHSVCQHHFPWESQTRRAQRFARLRSCFSRSSAGSRRIQGCCAGVKDGRRPCRPTSALPALFFSSACVPSEDNARCPAAWSAIMLPRRVACRRISGRVLRIAFQRLASLSLL